MTKPVYSFVAWSGTGKTTLLEKLVGELCRRGLRVGVLKHDGHDFDMDRPGKDTDRMTRAGAAVTVITNDAHAAILENRPLSVEQLVERMQDVDMVLVEGYKQGPYPKIGLVRSATGKGLPPIDGDYVLVVSDRPQAVACPVLGWEDMTALADFLQDLKR
jgi:molybdopterin-guanine dinucleotide biosynthesis protein MobB